MVDDRPVNIQCRKCDECVSHRKRHLLGKVLAEQQTAQEVWFSTYTYAGGYDDPKAYLLDYQDMQETFRLMRRAGHRFKYLVVGEFGDEGERAHWHALLFWETEPPEMPMGKRTPEEGDGYWSRGYVQHEHPRSQTGVAAYAMKYMTKNDTYYRKNIRKSCKLGDKYLVDLARKTARAGLPLFARGNIYTIAEQQERSRSGKQFYYPVERSSGVYERMLQAWLEEWALQRPNERLKQSEDTKTWLEDIVQDCDLLTPRVQAFILEHYGYGPWPDAPQMGPDRPRRYIPRIRETYFADPEFPEVTIRVNNIGISVGLKQGDRTSWLADVARTHGVTTDAENPRLTPEIRAAIAEVLNRPENAERLKRHRQVLQLATSPSQNPNPRNRGRPPRPGTATPTTHGNPRH